MGYFSVFILTPCFFVPLATINPSPSPSTLQAIPKTKSLFLAATPPPPPPPKPRGWRVTTAKSVTPVQVLRDSLGQTASRLRNISSFTDGDAGKTSKSTAGWLLFVLMTTVSDHG